MPANRLFLACCLVLAALAVPARAENFTRGGLHVEQPWARASSGSTAAVYMTIRNSGERPDALLSATTPTAKTAQLHVSTGEGGVTKMRPIDALEIAPAATVRLEPGHYHIMLLGLSEPLRPGSHFPLVLTFRNGGELSIMVDVLKAGSKGPPSIAIPDKPSTKQETGQ